jgi:ABC-type transport system involved in multi-copper enzyme maturation permease subunit
MNFLFHVFKKDLMRLKWVLTCWLGLLCVQSFLGIGGAQIAADNLNFQIFVPQLAMLINLLQGLMLIIIIPLLIQDDPLVGTTGFWFTRPIGRKELLITKGCFVLGILLLLSIIAEVIVFMVNGFLFKHILLAIPEIIIEKLAFMTPFLLLAAITSKFSRYALVGVIIFAGIIMLGILTVILGFLSPKLGSLTSYFANLEAIRNYTLGLSVKVVRKIFIILFGSGLIAHQYLSRKTKKTVLLAVLVFALLLIVNKLWRIDFIKPVSPEPVKNVVANTIKLTIDTNQVIVADALRYRRSDVREKTISAQVNISNLAPGEFAILTDLKPRIEFQNAQTLDSSYVSQISHETLDNAKFMESLQAILTNAKILNPFLNQRDYHEIFQCSETSFNRYKDTSGTYKASATFDIYKYKISASVPLRQGGREIFDSEQVVIFDILHQESGISVVVGEKKARLLFDRQMEKTNPIMVMERSFPRSIYLIENRSRGEAFVQEASDTSLLGYDEVMSTYSRLFSKAQRLDFVCVNNRSGSLPQLDQEWLKDAQLIRADAVRVGSVTKEVEYEGFRLPERSTVQAPERDQLEQNLRFQENISRSQASKGQ